MARLLALFALLCPLPYVALARGDSPVAIVNNTPCTVTGSIGYTGCPPGGDQFEYGPWSRGKLYPHGNAGCSVAAVLAGVDCGSQGTAKCAQFASGGVPPPLDGWKFQINGNAASGCQVVKA